MGATCACETKEEPNIEVAISVQKEPAKEAQATGLSASDQPEGVLSQDMAFQNVPSQGVIPEEPLETSPRFTEDHVKLLQNSFRSYITRKQQHPHLQEIIVFEPSADDAEQEEVEETVEPDSLTPEAKEKLQKLGPYEYKLKVAGGQMHGPLRMKDGSVFVGQLLKGKRHGRGKYYTKDGGYVEGYWNDVLHLHGRQILANGDSYEGGYDNGKKHGEGRYEDLKAENSYQGEWVADKKQGKGIERIADGSVYEGQFDNDEKNGFGIFKWASGEVYEGEFKDNIIHGRGKYVWKDTKWYEGDWAKGQMHGKGRFMNEGKEYEGDFVEDKKTGSGVYRWDGNLYEGEFKDNKMHGRGYLTMKGKERRLYNFENNKRGALIQEGEEQQEAS